MGPPAPEPLEEIRANPTDSLLSRLANPGLVLPIHDLVTGEAAHSDGTFAEVFMKPDELYAVYFPHAMSTGSIDLTAATGTFQRRGYEMRSRRKMLPDRLVLGSSVRCELRT